MAHPLDRIAAALDRLAPPPPAGDDAMPHPAYVWRDGALVAARAFSPVDIDLLIGIDQQKAALTGNLRRLAAGAAAQDVLLWGARGTGKSALVKAAVGAVQAQGGDIALVEVTALDALPRLFAVLAPVPRAFALFLDDLGFDVPAEARTLRSLLEGGAEARPANVRLIVTANRRHLIPRDIAEQSGSPTGASPGGGGAGGGGWADARPINPRDAIDDQLALSDRFGLSLGFHALDQDGYCAIVAAYAARYDLPFDAAEAINWATRRGSRSGRVAWQYVTELAGRAGRGLG